LEGTDMKNKKIPTFYTGRCLYLENVCINYKNIDNQNYLTLRTFRSFFAFKTQGTVLRFIFLVF